MRKTAPDSARTARRFGQKRPETVLTPLVLAPRAALAAVAVLAGRLVRWSWPRWLWVRGPGGHIAGSDTETARMGPICAFSGPGNVVIAGRGPDALETILWAFTAVPGFLGIRAGSWAADPGPVAAPERPQERSGHRWPCDRTGRAGDRSERKETPAGIGQGIKKTPARLAGVLLMSRGCGGRVGSWGRLTFDSSGSGRRSRTAADISGWQEGSCAHLQTSVDVVHLGRCGLELDVVP